MHNTAKRGAVLAVATGGLLLAGAAQSSAEAAVGIAENAGGPAGVLSGDSVGIPVDISLNLCGNGIAVLGSTMPRAYCDADSSGAAPTTVSRTAAAVSARSTVPRGGLLSAMAVRAPINIPVNACGNLAAVAGTADSGSGTTCSSTTAGAAAGGSSGSQPTPVTAVERLLGAALGAVSVQAPITVPANICGNTVSAGGTSSSAVTCTTGQSAAATSAATLPGASPAEQASGSAITEANGSDCPGPGSTDAGSAQTPASKSQQPVTTAVLAAPQTVAAPAALPAALSQNIAPAAQVPNPQPAAAAAVSKVHPNVAALNVAMASDPLVAHPTVVWPRAQAASAELPGGAATAHLTSPHRMPADFGSSALAQTGSETAIPIGAAAATLTGGLGVGALGRRGRGSRRSARR